MSQDILNRVKKVTVEELGVKDVAWINANGSEMADEHWGDHGMRCFGMLFDGRAQTTGIRQRGREATMLIIINEHSGVVPFKLPESPGGEIWTLLIDTNDPDTKKQSKSFQVGEIYHVIPRSLRLFVLE